MIEAHQFVEAARRHGFLWYAGVPCSYLTPFINYVLQDPSLHYLSMANEGDAVALIAGIVLGASTASGPVRGIAMMQNSGLGNAVSPLTSLTWTFRLPQLLIVTWRGQPGVQDEPQHALMGPITPAILEAMQIPWELFPTGVESLPAVLERATAHMDSTGRPYCLVMQKGSVESYPLKGRSTLTERRTEAAVMPRSSSSVMDDWPSRHDVLRRVIAQTPPDSTLIVASTGYCGRELCALEDRPNQLYMVGSMGCVVPLALGLALGRPDWRVLALDGDGAALMRLGAFATVGAYGPPNLWHLLLDNGAHESTGAQATVAGTVSFAQVAAGCGYTSADEFDSVAQLDGWLRTPAGNGPRFARIQTRIGTPSDLPRPMMSPVEVRTRLVQHIGSSAGIR